MGNGLGERTTPGVPLTYDKTVPSLGGSEPHAGGWLPSLAIVTVAVVAFHWPLLVNDGLYFEDFFLYDWFIDGRKDTFFGHFGMYGHLIPAYLMWPLSQLPNSIFFFKFTAFIFLLIASLATFGVLAKLGYFSRAQAALLAILAVVYPGHLTTAHINLVFHFICYAAFWTAALVVLESESKVRFLRVLYRMAAGFLFFLSFGLNSLLVFHFGFLAVLLLRSHSARNDLLPQTVRSFIAEYWDLIAIPFIFWIWRQVIVSPYGVGLAHTPIHIDLYQVFRIYLSAARLVITQIFAVGLYSLTFLFVFVALFFMLKKSGKLLTAVWSSASPNPFWILCFALLLIFLGVFPYAVTDRGLGRWDSDGSARNRILIMLPMALFLLSALAILLRKWPRIYIATLVALICSFGMYRLSVYETWQAEAIKNHSILTNLKQLPGVGDIHVFGVRDLVVEGFDRVRLPHGYSSMFLHPDNAFKLALGDFSRFVFYESASSDKAQEGPWYSKTDAQVLNPVFFPNFHITQFPVFIPNSFEPCGRQAALIISHGPGFQTNQMVFTYYYYKFFEPEKLREYVMSLTSLDLVPRKAPSSCASNELQTERHSSL
ncbi:hypothetical protein [Candidatus Nitronereus thalassa]|uniref:Glycosyltransferase RgtA/B/C/D-like domain-containing protein n=1 Tax=Candidatus Nitronereus thalassa TaxID=3020898 RepID=A0ABU3K5I2_9BACT|nr:hypothetical protein [Candidatus Nitronereus thalassa]MDT7041655.1 hypothetical protein [Candidatus Nitronereus thalassa]